MVTEEKAAGNPVGPRLPLDVVRTYEAGRRFLERKGITGREKKGDDLFRVAGGAALNSSPAKGRGATSGWRTLTRPSPSQNA